jgi:adenylate cyclase
MKPGTPLLRPTWWLSLGLAVGLLLSLARSAGLFNTWRLRSTDFLHGDTLLGEEIVIVTIDDASLGQLGSWPWTHSTHARLIETLAEARVISVDVLFETTEPDDPLVEATARAGNVIYPILAVLPERAEPGLIPAEALIEPASLLQGSAAGLGIANILPDGDGVVRRVPLAVQENDHRLEALSLQVLRRYLDLPAEPPGELDAGLFVAGLLEIPVDPWGRMTIHFASEPGTFPTVSYSDVLSGAVPPVTFQDKIVLVGQMGLTGGGDHHVVPTSHGGHPMAGVEVQANIIHAMLKQRYLREQSLSNDVLIIIGLALLSSLILPQIRWPWAVLCTLLLGAGCLLLSFVAFDRGLVLDLLYPTASLALSHVTVVTGRLVIEERRRRRVADLFGRYVSPEIMGEILSQQETAPLELGGEQREITVLFVDIRGYSAFSERLSPHRVVEVLNRHLARMTRVVFEHGGTVDKFTGDGLMALFGAPLAQQDHAVRAVQAALALQAAVQQANDGTLQYGIGIHTGEAVVGNIGSQRRLEYTAIGDTVNLAFRLEEQAAPGQILISQATFERAQGLIRAREIGPSPVKGRREAVVLYEVLAMLED